MKPLRLFSFALLLAAAASAQDIFPGLHAILTPAEAKRAGLDRLSPDEVGVIDAALIRYYMRVVTGVGPLPSAATLAAAQRADQAAAAASAPRETGFWERFGIVKLTGEEWRSQPPMLAKVTEWQGGNRFALDNGQVWEGVDNIPFELPGKRVIIQGLGNASQPGAKKLERTRDPSQSLMSTPNQSSRSDRHFAQQS